MFLRVLSRRKFIIHLTNLPGLHIILRSDDKTEYFATAASRGGASRQQAEEGSFERNCITIEAGHIICDQAGWNRGDDPSL